MAGIDQLIINSAYREPTHHWKYDLNGQTFVREEGRRPAGYFIAGQGSNQYNDIGQFIELPLVNRIRPRVKAWREAGYPGVTGVTRKLLDHWNDKDARQYPFFYCQMDAIETLIWLTEAPDAEKVGIDIPSDGGAFRRLCTKLCTGGGKTTVMAMLIAWMICNKVTYPQDKRFTKYVFIVAPGLTVKSRLQVLQTGGDNNYYIQFNIVPIGLMDKLYQGKVMITNWQSLAWDSAETIAKRRSVDKRGAKSDEAYTREVLGEMANASNILVINDEAHHAWRKNPENKAKLTKEQKEAEQQATIWISGLDRIHKTRGILSCYDFSATPFAPSGKKNDEEALFGWIVSDFGLNDGIESGLVKTPRVVVRDDGTPDAESFRSKLYHIYADETVKDDINRAADPEEPLPDLLTQAYYLLGKDWQALYYAWKDAGADVPPVMITVANRTETAARIKYAFDHGRIPVPELCDPNLTIHIDSKTMDAATNVVAPTADEDSEAKISKADAADTRLRADLAPIIDGKTDLTKCTEIDLQKLDAELRMQRIVFEASGQVYDLMKTSWQNEATKFALLGQVIRLVEEYLKSGAIVINPPLFNTDPVRQRIIYMMNMNKIVQHLWSFIKLEQTEKIAPIFDPNKKIRSTADMPTWFTSKPCCITKTSQISHCVFDSAWEATESYVIEKNPHVTAWAKNDHLGFEILYIFDGVVRKYLPDFLIRLDNGKTLILETKGQETRRDKEKRKALFEWVAAVNSLGEYGEWCNDISYNIADVEGIIAKYI